ncbi:MAG: hypothetical protein LBJ11_04480 [Oscillospiraceae bacterium]|jgi:hypothetical protein|nr:hypothetical protein [Oscillospiraceae bacterium]
MKQSLFNESAVAPACEHCLLGRQAPDGSSVLCNLRGVMRKQSSCRKYCYDPLKRQPLRTPILPKFEAEQFAL